MTYLRLATTMTLVALIVLVLGCSASSGPSSNPTQILGPNPPQTKATPTSPGAQPTQTLAKVKSSNQAKAVTSAPGGGPRLAIDVDSIDFGEVQFGAVVAYSFNVKNVGSTPASLGLPFIRVKEGC